MKSALIVVAVMFAFIVGASSSLQTDKAKQSSDTLEKMRQLDLLNQILPLVMTKDQIRQLLPTIEKARRDVKAEEDTEAGLIAQVAPEINAAVKAGIEKGEVPDKALLKKANAVIRTMAMRRNAIASDNVDMVLGEMKKILNAGQLKAAANSLSTSVYMPDVKPEEIKDDQKLQIFVREIMLDPLAYDILVKLQKGPIG